MHNGEKVQGVGIMKGFRLPLLLCVCIVFVSVLHAASPHTVYGVLDRYTDNGLAVILLEDNQVELHVQEEELPESSEEGVWYRIQRNAGVYSVLSIDWAKTKALKKASKKLMEQLRGK